MHLLGGLLIVVIFLESHLNFLEPHLNKSSPTTGKLYEYFDAYGYSLNNLNDLHTQSALELIVHVVISGKLIKNFGLAL